MSLFKQLLVRCPLRLDNPAPILVAKVGVCLAQEPAAFKAFPSDTLIFEPVGCRNLRRLTLSVPLLNSGIHQGPWQTSPIARRPNVPRRLDPPEMLLDSAA